MIYGVVSKGYISFQALADNSVSMKTLFRAKHLAEFDEWVKEKARQAAERKKDVVEYFE